MRGNGNGTSLEAQSLDALMVLKTAAKTEMDRIEAAISAKREAERQTRQALIELAQSRGFDAKELLLSAGRGGRPAKATASATKKKTHKGKKPAKYRDPSDPKRTWSGFGKAPGWLHKLTKDGTPRQTFQVSR